MRLLLDTHAIIWWVDQDQLLSQTAHRAIADPANDLLVSAASIWEIAIKAGLGKLTLSIAYREWMEQAIADLGAAILPITVNYAGAQLDLANHHRDPFDRLLVAQATVENVPIVSGDTKLDPCGIQRLW